jgi:cell division septal protein FtsQ
MNHDIIDIFTVKKLKDTKAIGKMLIVGIIIVVIIVAGVVGYYLSIPQPKVKDTLIIGTTSQSIRVDSVLRTSGIFSCLSGHSL